MSNFQCPECGTTHIDCGKDGYKTSKEIKLEEKIAELEKALGKQELLNSLLHAENGKLILNFEQYKKSKQHSYEEIQRRCNDLEWQTRTLETALRNTLKDLIRANVTDKINDTLWHDDITTLFDYIALSIGISNDEVAEMENKIIEEIRKSKKGEK